jgi:hypothetical protein
MVRFLICVFALLMAACCAHADEGRTVTITVENETPEFTVVPSIAVFGGESQSFTELKENKFEYKFHVDASEWFNFVDIKIEWKKAFLENDGTKSDFKQRIQLRIRRDFPDAFSVPVFFSNARSNNEMFRLENEQDPTDQFEVFFRAWQIAAYYRKVTGVSSSYAARASQILFYAAVALAEQRDYFVEMSDDAEKFVNDAFGPERFAARANLARSVYWSDLSEVDKFVAKGDCDTAHLLIQALRVLAGQHPEEFTAQYKNAPNIIDLKDQLIRTKCK